ncbi:MAG TPA: hypothetical protein VN903_09415, partial [Polyangia bacterium]|nr:hypothetical protein [Polyangia bacterium]
LAAAIAIAHVGGRSVGAPRPVALLAASIVLGAIIRSARSIPLEGCARFADAALDRQDRVLSALCLRDQETPLARALVQDAVARTRTLAPGGAVAPRRPKGLPALAMGAVVLAAAAVAPVRSRAARVPIAVPPAPGVPLTRGALDVEREEARRAAEAAALLHDERLAALAGELQGTLRRLSAGQLSDGDALEKLSELQRQAAEAAAQAARDAKAFEAAKKALESEPATRGAGEALTAEDADAARARAALGAAAAENPTQTARALASAARGVGNTLGGQEGDGGNDPRRLSRESDDKEGSAASEKPGDGDRRLERLQRNLDGASRACRDGDPSCKSRAEKSGGDLSQMGNRGASAEALRQLERALRQMRERLGRGEMRGGDQSGMRRFERAARGESGQPGQGQGQPGQQGEGQQGDGVGTSEGGGQGEGDATAEQGGESGKTGQGQSGQRGQDGKPGDGQGQGQAGKGQGQGQGKGQGEDGEGEGTGEAAALLAERETVEARGSSAPGDGIGNGRGGPPLGQRGDMQARGHETEARVASGAGPNRAEVIGGAADRGFAQRGYARVFADYQAAVEDALATTAVPEGRRYVVRRYFDLIRPRTGKAPRK